MDEKYFDAQQALRELERTTGREASAWLKSVLEEVEPFLNRAYNDGFKAGLVAAGE